MGRPCELGGSQRWPEVVDGEHGAIDWQELMAFKRTFTDPLPEKMEQRYREKGIDAYHGKARFVGKNTLQVSDDVL